MRSKGAIAGLLPMARPELCQLPNHPPTKADGARRVKIIRTVRYGPGPGNVRCAEGQRGVVIPLHPQALYDKIEGYKDWIAGGAYNYEGDHLQCVYDFFWEFTKNGVTQVGVWHNHISRFDFEYLPDKADQLTLF